MADTTISATATVTPDHDIVAKPISVNCETHSVGWEQENPIRNPAKSVPPEAKDEIRESIFLDNTDVAPICGACCVASACYSGHPKSDEPFCGVYTDCMTLCVETKLSMCSLHESFCVCCEGTFQLISLTSCCQGSYRCCCCNNLFALPFNSHMPCLANILGVTCCFDFACRPALCAKITSLKGSLTTNKSPQAAPSRASGASRFFESKRLSSTQRDSMGRRLLQMASGQKVYLAMINDTSPIMGLCCIMSACCSQSSISENDGPCSSAAECECMCCEADFVCCKTQNLPAPAPPAPSICVTCCEGALHLSRPTVCMKGTSSCCCFTNYCALPCDAEVPCLLNICGLSCCFDGKCNFKTCASVRELRGNIRTSFLSAFDSKVDDKGLGL